MFIKLHFKKFETPAQRWADININVNEIKYYWQYADEISAIILFKDNAQLKVKESIEEIEKKINDCKV
jgi:hypothetical protein